MVGRIVGKPLAISGEQLTWIQDLRTENGSIQGLKLALAGWLVPSSLDSGSGQTSIQEVRCWEAHRNMWTNALQGYQKTSPPRTIP